MKIKTLSQRVGSWANQRLGFSASTIGGWGCAITALAMLLNWLLGEDDFDPTIINTTLKADRTGYHDSNLVNWPVLPEIFSQLKYNGRIDCQDRPAPLGVITNRLLKDTPMIVYVDARKDQPPAMRGTKYKQHFVLAVQQGESGLVMMDPWHGDCVPLCPRYGRNDAEAIGGIILLDRAQSTTSRLKAPPEYADQFNRMH